MHINVSYPYFQTALFVGLLIATVVLTAKKDHAPHAMNHTHTNELKGVAILMVLFSHIGYFLFSDHTFLYPLSVAGGLGVNIFLFLSGFGLASSSAAAEKSLWHFYIKRFLAIFVPMWMVLFATLLADFYLQGRTYDLVTIVQSVVGFFPNADLSSAINSPLWYFSLILFYYLVFPLIYRQKHQVLSSAVMLLVGYLVVNIYLPVSKDVLKLYELHYMAFPLGMLFAYLYEKKPGVKIMRRIVKLSPAPWVMRLVFLLLIGLLVVLLGYTAIHSGVGGKISVEQLTSLLSLVILVFIFLIKSVQSNLLIVLGVYSYEIYLIQWPLMFRHDYIYKNTNAFLGTVIYVAVLLVAGFVLNKLVKAAGSRHFFKFL